MKKFLHIIGRLFVCALVVALFVTLPLLKGNMESDFSMIFNAFVGVKSKYQGIIVVWNIDNFESGSAPKSKYLEAVARSFEKQNKGTYVLVRNLNEYECLTLLEKGELPDVFSCTYGLAEKLKDYIIPMSAQNSVNISKNLLEAGKVDSELYALAWCRGVYCLLSTTEKLSAAGKTLEEGQKLSSIALSSGYEIKKKNSTKTVSSLTFGAGGGILPQNAFLAYTGSGLESTLALELDQNSFSQSQYSAYANFLAGGGTILLGTQRDVFRLEGRLASGKISDIIFEPLISGSDLVQFLMLASSGNSLRQQYAESYMAALVDPKNQARINMIGMLPVASGINPYSEGIMKHIASEINESYEAKRVFD